MNHVKTKATPRDFVVFARGSKNLKSNYCRINDPFHSSGELPSDRKIKENGRIQAGWCLQRPSSSAGIATSYPAPVSVTADTDVFAPNQNVAAPPRPPVSGNGQHGPRTKTTSRYPKIASIPSSGERPILATGATRGPHPKLRYKRSQSSDL